MLKHMFSTADIPVVQLSIDETRPPIFHYEMGHRLMSLREEGILIIGSGNIVHNLAAYNWNNKDIPPFDRAMRFEKYVREMLIEGDLNSLINYQNFGDDAMLSVPIPDHYLPLYFLKSVSKENYNTDKFKIKMRTIDG